MRSKTLRLITALVSCTVVVSCASFPDVETTRVLGEAAVKSSFTAPSPAMLARLDQDRSQQICSKTGAAKLTEQEVSQVIEAARASFQYPLSGKIVGDWRIGERLAHDGAGDRIQGGKLEARKENGGLCQNCHALAAGEINVGNIGPSLTAYGRERGTSDAIAKFVYEKIYNAWAYLPCSNMPRLGATGHLTPEQISHLVAYLIDPKSPINAR
jgi:sulfur-oxidizing protein SoxX